jgi:hypothetical protein
MIMLDVDAYCFLFFTVLLSLSLPSFRVVFTSGCFNLIGHDEPKNTNWVAEFTLIPPISQCFLINFISFIFNFRLIINFWFIIYFNLFFMKLSLFYNPSQGFSKLIQVSTSHFFCYVLNWFFFQFHHSILNRLKIWIHNLF